MDRQADRQTDRETDRQTDIQTDRQRAPYSLILMVLFASMIQDNIT